MQMSQAAELIYSEALTVRQKALLSKAATDSGTSTTQHWSERACKQSLLDVMGRMTGDPALLEKLLLHGL